MSYRARVMVVGALVALPLLLLSLVGAISAQVERERALGEDGVAIGRAVAAATMGFLDADIAAVRAIAALPAVRDYPHRAGDVLDQAMWPVLQAFPDLETLGLIGLDGWNVRSLTRNVPVPPRSVNVLDRPYFQQALATGQTVVSPAVQSRVRPGVPVVAIAVPIAPPDDTGEQRPRGVLVGTLALEQLRQNVQSVLPDPRLGVVLLDADGQVLVSPEIDPAASRPLASLRGRPDVDAVLRGETGSQHVWSPDGQELLVSYAPVPRAGWGVLVQQPANAALAPVRFEAVRSVGLLVLALAFSCGLAWFQSSRLARSYNQLDLARDQAERGRQRSAFLAECSRRLAATLDPQATLQAVAQLAVPVLADWCLVDLLGEPGATRRLAVAHRDPARAPLARALQEHPPADLNSHSLYGRLARTGEPLLVAEVSDALLVEVARGPSHLALLRQIAPRSGMVVPLRGRTGLLGAITFMTAESDRRYTQDDLDLAQDLAGRAALAVENARLFAEVQQAVRTRDEFLASASHDLKNPLSSVKILAQLLRRRAARAEAVASADVVAAAEHIDSIVTRAADLVDELLDVARLQLGRPLELERRPVDLLPLLRETLAEFGATSASHTLRLDAPDEPVVGQWDRARIRRAVDNLLGNAIKYSPDGGEVLVSLRREPLGDLEGVVLSIRDQGLGIPQEDLPHIFERFHRGANVGRVSGTGVGLASTRAIVEGHGGTISLHSQEGQGTLVVVHLPLTAHPVPQPA